MSVQFPIDWAPIYTAIQNWATAAMGLPVIWTTQDAPALSKPYATLNVGPIGTVGRDETRPHYDSGTDKVYFDTAGQRRFTLSCQVFTPTSQPPGHAGAYLELLSMNVMSEATRATLLAAGLSVIDVVDVTDLDDIANGQWESRGNLDILFGVAANLTDTSTGIDRIVRAGGTGSVHGGKTDPDTITLNVSAP